MQLLVEHWRGHTVCCSIPHNVAALKTHLADLWGVPADNLRTSLNSKELQDDYTFTTLDAHQIAVLPPIRVSLRLLGGKGGFGALLRGSGARVNTRSANFDDCRDLSGRRIRHVKDEKKLAEWYRSEKDRELARQREKEEQKRLEAEQMMQEKRKTEMQLQEYQSQLRSIEEDVETSVQEALKEAKKLKKQQKQSERPKKRQKKGNMLFDDFVEDEEEEGEKQEEQKEEQKLENHHTNQEQVQVQHQVQEQPNHAQENGMSTTENNTTTTSTTSGAIPNQSPATEEEIDLSKFQSAEEMESLGLERLKTELSKRGFICGGTLQDRAQRLFAVWNKPLDQVDPKLLAQNRNHRKRKKTA